MTKNPDPSTGCNAKFIGINFIVWDASFKQSSDSALKLTAKAQKMRDLDFTIPGLVATPTSSVKPTTVEGNGSTFLSTSFAAVGLALAATYL